MPILLLKFAACAAVIFFSGAKVAKYADIIAEKTRLGGVWIGVVLVSITTSLPEVFTGISASALVAQPDISVGDLVGANGINILKLALLDFFSQAPILGRTKVGNTLGGVMSIVMLSLVAVSIWVSAYASLGVGWIGIYTPIIILGYLAMLKMLYDYESRHRQGEGTVLGYEHISAKRAYIVYAISAVVIAGAGVYLAFVADELALVTGLGHSFVGSVVVSFITTLPEITVGVAAFRMGAIDIVVGDTVGSNMFNMAVVAIDDLFFFKGPVLAYVSQGNVITALVVLLMSTIMIMGLLLAPERKWHGVTWYAPVLVALFVVGAFLSFVGA